MAALKRLVGLLGAVIVVGMLLSLSGGPSMKYMVSPGSLFLVLAMTIGLGLYTYSRKRLFGAFREIFSIMDSQPDPQNKRMLSQLALYALLSGIVLALVQILLQSFRTSEGFDRIGSDPLALRAPLTTLLYAVLMALGLWLITGHRVSKEGSSETDGVPFYRQFSIGASLLLLMMIGLVSLLVVGMTKDSSQRNSDKSPNGDNSPKVADKIDGLYRGKDFYWRPMSMSNSEPTPSPSCEERKTSNHNAYLDSRSMVSDAVPRTDDIPLRWELSLNESAMKKEIVSPIRSRAGSRQAN